MSELKSDIEDDELYRSSVPKKKEKFKYAPGCIGPKKDMNVWWLQDCMPNMYKPQRARR